MNEKLIGSFYFKKTNDFNLIGEFANNDATNERMTTECANKNPERTDDFRGSYTSVWHDTGLRTATLTISFKFDGSSNTIYTLEWKEGANTTYTGEGFLLDANTLIGFYQEP